MEKPWNEGSQVPIHKWLSESQSEQDKLRLQAMGNIVVPAQAMKALVNLSQFVEELSAEDIE